MLLKSLFSINMSFSFPVHYQDILVSDKERFSVVVTQPSYVFALMVSVLSNLS